MVVVNFEANQDVKYIRSLKLSVLSPDQVRPSLELCPVLVDVANDERCVGRQRSSCFLQPSWSDDAGSLTATKTVTVD